MNTQTLAISAIHQALEMVHNEPYDLLQPENIRKVQKLVDDVNVVLVIYSTTPYGKHTQLGPGCLVLFPDAFITYAEAQEFVETIALAASDGGRHYELILSETPLSHQVVNKSVKPD